MSQQTIVLADKRTITGTLIEHCPHGHAEVEQSGVRFRGEKWEHYVARVNRAASAEFDRLGVPGRKRRAGGSGAR